jgi:hypothetical protein
MTDKDLDRLFEIVKEAEADELPALIAIMEREKLRRQLAEVKRPLHRWIVSAVVSLLYQLGRVRETILAMFNDPPPGGAA